MDMYKLITTRHSARKYTKEVVSDDHIKHIIDAGLAAPSGGNTQPWHFTVIKNQKAKQQLVDMCKNAFLNSGIDWRINWAKLEEFNPFYDPSVIIVISNNNMVDKSNEDCCFAIQNMVLMAEALGLSSCIIRDICWAINKDNQKEYGIPKEFDCFMCISVGYAAVKNTRKKDLDCSKVNYIN